MSWNDAPKEWLESLKVGDNVVVVSALGDDWSCLVIKSRADQVDAALKALKTRMEGKEVSE